MGRRCVPIGQRNGINASDWSKGGGWNRPLKRCAATERGGAWPNLNPAPFHPPRCNPIGGHQSGSTIYGRGLPVVYLHSHAQPPGDLNKAFIFMSFGPPPPPQHSAAFQNGRPPLTLPALRPRPVTCPSLPVPPPYHRSLRPVTCPPLPTRGVGGRGAPYRLSSRPSLRHVIPPHFRPP